MSIKLIAVDMDGIPSSDVKIYNRPRPLAQYQRTREQNIRLVIASGNQYYQLISFFLEIVHQIASVAENGGWAVSGNGDVFNYQLPFHHFNVAVDHLQTLSNIKITACGGRSAYTPNRYNGALKMVATEYYHHLGLADDSNHLDDAIFKFGLNVSDSLILEIQPELHVALGDMVTAVATGYGSIDLTMPGVYKVNGLHILQQRWDIEDYEVVAFGDSGNDIEILQHAGFGLVMVNVRENVKAVASHHAPHNSEEGVLQIIDKMLNRKASFA